MRFRWLDGLVLAYGVLLIVMGIYAYYVSRHLPSLVMGSLFGILEIFFASIARTNPRVGRIGAAVIALAVGGMFVSSYFTKAHKIDFLILWVSSLLVFLCLLGGHFAAMGKRRSA